MAIGGARRGEFAFMLLLSGAGHLALLALLLVHFPSRAVVAPAVIAVDLVAAPAAKAARPAPAPPPAPATPRPREPEKVLLPKEPQRETSKPEEPKPRPVREKPRPPEPPPAPARSEPKEYDDVLAQLRAEAGEERPEPRRVAAVAPPPGAVPGAETAPGARVSPEVAAWIRLAKRRVRDVWVVPPGFRTQDLEAHVMVQIDASGRVLGEPEIVSASGNPWYDEGVVRAIQKASPLPPPPEADRWRFVFVPEDSF